MLFRGGDREHYNYPLIHLHTKDNHSQNNQISNFHRKKRSEMQDEMSWFAQSSPFTPIRKK